jgi:uncharacterized protein (DUF302 family)
MLIRVLSSRPLDEIGRAIEEAATKRSFGVIATHDLQETMKRKGVEMDMECRIYEVCNPAQAKRVLEADGSISTALPCRISVYGKPGAYTIASMLPTEMMKAFPVPEIEPVAREVEEVIKAIVTEAAG